MCLEKVLLKASDHVVFFVHVHIKKNKSKERKWRGWSAGIWGENRSTGNLQSRWIIRRRKKGNSRPSSSVLYSNPDTGCAPVVKMNTAVSVAAASTIAVQWEADVTREDM